jgi:phosphatidylserine decarboxylase
MSSTVSGRSGFSGGVAHHLPSPEGLAAFHQELKARVADALSAAPAYAPSVQAMADLIAGDSVMRMYVEQMLAQVEALPGAPISTIVTVDELLAALNTIVTLAPLYNADKSKRVAFPMSALFGYMMMTLAGEALFRNSAFNGALRGILQAWCAYLDSPASTSVLNDSPTGWYCPAAVAEFDLNEFVFDPNAPHGGWDSYNDFFHRQIQLQYRPIASPGDPSVVVSANDGNIVSLSRGVQRTDQFWLKGEPFSLSDMLNGTEYVDRFVGGDVFQVFLSGGNYHRWRAPVGGTVVYAQVIDGLMFSDAESAGWDPSAVLSEGYYAAVNTRGLVIIDSGYPVLGMVCVIPIGITEISSVTIEVSVGQAVAKGDELGYFSYGGSSLCLVFQPGAMASYLWTDADLPTKPLSDPTTGPPVEVNAQIGTANLAAR